MGGPVDARVCAQHGRELMGCKSPVGVPTWTHREQAEPRAEGKGRPARGGPKEAGVQEVRGDGQKSHSQGRGRRGELAHGSKAHRYAAYGKCGACAPTVRVLTWGDLRRWRRVASTTDPAGPHRDIKDQTLRRAARRERRKRQRSSTRRTARPAETSGVTAQKSAEAIVGNKVS